MSDEDKKRFVELAERDAKNSGAHLLRLKKRKRAKKNPNLPKQPLLVLLSL